MENTTRHRKSMKKVIYEPNKYLKTGIGIWRTMFEEIGEGRELIWRLFVRDLSAKYKQSVLGYVWVLVTPFIAIGTFMVLNKSGIFTIGSTDIPYPLFALIGLAVWQLFVTGINSGCQSLVGAGDMITKINFPREVLVLASLAQALFEFGIKCVLIILFFMIFQFYPSWQIIFFPLLVLPMLILTLGFSLILSLVNGIIRDTANTVGIITTFLMFLTPVLYPIPANGNLFFKLNPLAALVNAPRDIIAYGYVKEPMEFIVASGLSFILFLIFWRIFHLVETKIPERI